MAGTKRDFALIKHSHALGELDDLDLAGAADNSLIQYDAASGDWQDVTLANVNGQLDHGLFLGLSDDDHPQYPLAAGTETIAGAWTFNVTPVVPNDSWAYAKIQNVSATSRVLGRITSGAGDIEELTAANLKTILALVAADISDFTEAAQDAIGTAGLADSSTIDLSYNDGAGTISADVILSATYAWTGNHSWSVNAQKGPEIAGTTPNLAFYETDATADEGRYRLESNVDTFFLMLLPDNESDSRFAWLVDRTGYTPTAFRLPNDNEELTIGAGNDLRISHNGTNTLIRNDTGSLLFSMSGTTYGTLAQAGNWTLAAPSSGRCLSVNGAASQYSMAIAANTGAGTSFGFLVSAGTNSSDTAFALNNAANSATYFNMRGDGAFSFNGATPQLRPNYTVTNPTTNRSLDVTGATLGQLREVVGTLIADFIAYGILQ